MDPVVDAALELDTRRSPLHETTDRRGIAPAVAPRVVIATTWCWTPLVSRRHCSQQEHEEHG
jgi:hypothetical protein